MAINNVVLFVNGKGGVLKSTAASHLAGYAAATGWDVLAIDADAQANQSRDLGYVPDGGEAFAAALRGTAELRPVPHKTRPTLHYVAGGPALDSALAELGSSLARGQVGALRSFERALAPVASQYHLVVVDSPPRELLLRRILFTAGRFVVVPCQVDDGSVDGIAGVLETVRDVRDVDGLNPDLEVLGAFLGPVQNGAAKTSRMAREKINDLVGEEDFVFETTIRSAQAISSYCRQEGILSNDYELLAGQVAQRRKRWFKQTAEERLAAKAKHSFSEAAPGLARDWQLLVTEIMLRFGARSDMKQAAQDNA